MTTKRIVAIALLTLIPVAVSSPVLSAEPLRTFARTETGRIGGHKVVVAAGQPRAFGPVVLGFSALKTVRRGDTRVQWMIGGETRDLQYDEDFAGGWLSAEGVIETLIRKRVSIRRDGRWSAKRRPTRTGTARVSVTWTAEAGASPYACIGYSFPPLPCGPVGIHRPASVEGSIELDGKRFALPSGTAGVIGHYVP